VRSGEERSDERRLEQSDRKYIILPSYITNNLLLVASLLASPIILTPFAIRFAHHSPADETNPKPPSQTEPSDSSTSIYFGVDSLTLDVKIHGCKVAMPCSDLSAGLDSGELLDVVVLRWKAKSLVKYEFHTTFNPSLRNLLGASGVAKDVVDGFSKLNFETAVHGVTLVYNAMGLSEAKDSLEVRGSKERSNELPTLALGTRAVLAPAFVQDTPPPLS